VIALVVGGRRAELRARLCQSKAIQRSDRRLVSQK